VADRDSVFERFTRLQESRHRDSGGSGLGLAIVRTVAVAHGGTAIATETPEGSCRFEICLPAAGVVEGPALDS
jgi:signal transduction histidine kinase